MALQDLAFRFQTSASTVSHTFTLVNHVLYKRLKPWLYWPEREELRKTMPLEFHKNFGQKVAVVIDCFEVFIQRPSNLKARAQTWSSYKHSNTVKFLIGITPQGSVSFLSKAWGGCASDKFVTENCGLLRPFFDISMFKIFLILYADDIVIFANNATELQSSLNSLSEYCSRWKLVVNTNKTKIMVFRKAGRLQNNVRFYYQSAEIEIVSKFTY